MRAELTVTVDRQRIYHKRDRLRQLRAFCYAVGMGGFAGAARSLGLSPRAVSNHVRELEHETETWLFERIATGVRLTAAGESLYALAEPLVRRMDALPDDIRQSSDESASGHLDLATGSSGASFVLPHYIMQFRDRFPGVRVRVRNCLSREALRLLLDDKVALALGAKDSLPPESLQYHPLLAYDIVLITSLDHPLAGRDRVSLAEVAEWPAIVPPTGTRSRQLGEATAELFGVEIKPVIEVGGWGVIKRYVESGLGISVVPGVCISETDQLSVIPLRECFPKRSFGVFMRRDADPGPIARHFLRLMMPGSRTAPASLPDPGLW